METDGRSGYNKRDECKFIVGTSDNVDMTDLCFMQWRPTEGVGTTRRLSVSSSSEYLAHRSLAENVHTVETDGRSGYNKRAEC